MSKKLLSWLVLLASVITLFTAEPQIAEAQGPSLDDGSVVGFNRTYEPLTSYLWRYTRYAYYYRYYHHTFPSDFEFWYDGKRITNVTFQGCGAIKLQAATETGRRYFYDDYYRSPLSTNNGRWDALDRYEYYKYNYQTSYTGGFVYAFHAHLYYNYSNYAAEMRMQRFGTAPNRYYVFEWYRMGWYYPYYNESEFTFQIRLYEGSNEIEFHYGPMSRGNVNCGDLYYNYGSYGYYGYDALMGFSSYYPRSTRYINIDPNGNGNTGNGNWEWGKPSAPLSNGYTKYSSVRNNATFDAIQPGDGIRLTYGISFVDETPDKDATLIRGNIYGNNTTDLLGQGNDQKPGVHIKQSAGTATVTHVMSGPLSFPVHPDYKVIYDAQYNNVPEETYVTFTTQRPGATSNPAFGANGNLDLTDTDQIKGGLYLVEQTAYENGKEYENDYNIAIALEYDLEVSKPIDPKPSNQKKYPLTAQVPVKIQFKNRGLNPISSFSAVYQIYSEDGALLKEDSLYWEAIPGQELQVSQAIDLEMERFQTNEAGLFRFVLWTYYVGDQESMNNTWPWANQGEHWFRVAPEIEAEALTVLEPTNVGDLGEAVKLYVGRPLTPRARFQNNGITDISDATGTMIIRSLPDMEERYSSEIIIADIPQGMEPKNSSDWDFEEFVPPFDGSYQACITVEALDDDFPMNDNICDTFEVVHALAGVYTIGPRQSTGDYSTDSAYNARNFESFQEAVDALYLIGVTAPVIFEFTTNSYTVGATDMTGREPTVDFRSVIVGVNETNTITFRPSSSMAVAEGNITVNLYSGSGIGMIFGQALSPRNLNAVIHQVPTGRQKSYANSSDYITFDGGQQRALKFILHSPAGTALAAPFYLSQGASNITIKNCIIKSQTPANAWDDCSLPHSRFNEPQYLFESDTRSNGTMSFSAGIFMRSIPPQDDINFFDPDIEPASAINQKNLDTLVSQNITIENNDISGFAYGVVSLGIGPLMRNGITKRYYNMNNTYANNYIHNVSRAGIFLGHEESSEISHNKIAGVANATTGFNSGYDVAGIMLGGERDGVQNGYNNIDITLNANEISDVGLALNEAANNYIYGIKVEQCRNTYGGSNHYPDVAGNMTITNNAIWGIRSGHSTNNRFGIRLFTERNTAAGTWNLIMQTPIVGSFFTQGDKIVNNTIIIDDDSYNTTGVVTGIGIQQAYMPVIKNNAIAMMDDNNAGAANLYAAVFYQGVHPNEDGGIVSNRNVYWMTPEGSPTDSAALFRFMYTDDQSTEIYAGLRDEFLTLNQWQMYTGSEDFLSVNFNFLDNLTMPDVDDPEDMLRINNDPTWPVGSKLNNRGEIIDYIPYDIDGNMRGASGQYYDIGAFEFPGILLNSDVEVTTSHQPGAYRATTTTFSDAEYIMTEAPVEIKAELYNNGSLTQTGLEVTVNVYREMPGGGFYDSPELTETIRTNLVASEAVEVAFNLADGLDKEFYPSTYNDWNYLYYDDPEFVDSLYTIPGWYKTMANNITPLYKIVIHTQADEEVTNNVYEKVVRFYLKRSALDMLISVDNSYFDLYPGSTDDQLAGHRNYDSLKSYLKTLGWENKWIEEEGPSWTLSQHYDVFERTAWEPRAVNYAMYRTLLWSDSDEEAMTREMTLDIDKFIANGTPDYKKNLIIGSQEMVRINYASFEDWVKTTLRAQLQPGYPTDPLNGTSYNAGETQPALNITDDTKWILGENIGRLLTQYIMRTGLNPADPDPLPGLMTVYAPGNGLASTAFVYNEDVVAGPDPKETTMGTAITSLVRNTVYMGVDWRHFGDGETIMRATLDFLEKNNGAIIPVELLSFDAEAMDNRVLISWETASEINSSRFEVERAVVTESGNGIFNRISELPAAGKSADRLTYGPVVDDNVEFNTKYAYRLKMIDLDGEYEYSDVVEVWVGNGAMQLSEATPNPATYETSFEYTSAEEGVASMEVYDLSGRVVLSLSNIAISLGNNVIELDLSTLNNGVYTCMLKFGETSYNKQVRVLK